MFRITSIIIALVCVPYLLYAASNEISYKNNNNKLKEILLDKNLKFDIEMAYENINSKLSKKRQASRTRLNTPSLGAGYQFSEEVKLKAELLGETLDEKIELFLGENYIQYQPSFYKNIKAQAGQIYYSYGLLTGKTALYSALPVYYKDLLVGSRGLDFGANFQWQFIKEIPVFLSYSVYEGQTYRSGDRKIQKAHLKPQVVQLKYQPQLGKIKFSLSINYLKRQYKNNPVLSGFGAELEFEPIKFKSFPIEYQPMFEYWELSNKLKNKQKVNSFLVGQKLKFKKIYYKWLYSESKTTAYGSSNITSKSPFQMHAVGYQLSKHFNIEYQNILSVANYNGFSMLKDKQNVFRIYFKL